MEFVCRITIDRYFLLLASRMDRVLMGKPEGKRPMGRPRRR